jgi:hypothetical protein
MSGGQSIPMTATTKGNDNIKIKIPISKNRFKTIILFIINIVFSFTIYYHFLSNDVMELDPLFHDTMGIAWHFWFNCMAEGFAFWGLLYRLGIWASLYNNIKRIKLEYR